MGKYDREIARGLLDAGSVRLGPQGGEVLVKRAGVFVPEGGRYGIRDFYPEGEEGYCFAEFLLPPKTSTRPMKLVEKGLRSKREVLEGSGVLIVQRGEEILAVEMEVGGEGFELRTGDVECFVAGPNGAVLWSRENVAEFRPGMEIEATLDNLAELGVLPEFWGRRTLAFWNMGVGATGN